MTTNTATAPRCVRILLVEDNPAYVYLIRETLQQNGLHFELDVAEDGAEAMAFLDRAEQQNGGCPDLILLDLNLPKRDGNEVLRRIKQSAKCAATPVAILTSSDSPLDRAAAERLGASCYIRKPSSLDELSKIGAMIKELVCGRALP